MKPSSYEGLLVALLPQRGTALLQVLRDAAREILGSRELQGWAVEYGPLASPAGAVAFRLTSLTESFPWRDGSAIELARIVSRLGKGRCWSLALEKPGRAAEAEGWAEGVCFDRGDRVGYEEVVGSEARSELLAWFGEQLALSENEILAAFESCDQTAGVLGGEERSEDEVDRLLEKARKEFSRYRELRDERERQRS